MNTFTKRTLLGLLFIVCSLSSTAQMSTCAYYDGYWGKWKDQFSYSRENYYSLYGNYSGFIVYLRSSHPSEYVFKFFITSYNPPTKENIKFHYKNKVWYEYSGYVEYFINDIYPSIKSALRIYSFAHLSNDVNNIKRTAKATIKIAPYKDHPRVYNFFFEDVGIGIDIGNARF